jgi:uncharacterized membrane protein
MMSYLHLAYLHLLTVVPAFALGTYLLMSTKGTPRHRALGKCYMVLMLITALLTLFMPAQVGPQWLQHFGYIHLLSVLTLWAVPVAFFAARRGQVARHKRAMITLYVGGLMIAGGFALMPGRLLHGWVFG